MFRLILFSLFSLCCFAGNFESTKVVNIGNGLHTIMLRGEAGEKVFEDLDVRTVEYKNSCRTKDGELSSYIIYKKQGRDYECEKWITNCFNNSLDKPIFKCHGFKLNLTDGSILN